MIRNKTTPGKIRGQGEVIRKNGDVIPFEFSGKELDNTQQKNKGDANGDHTRRKST